MGPGVRGATLALRLQEGRGATSSMLVDREVEVEATEVGRRVAVVATEEVVVATGREVEAVDMEVVGHRVVVTEEVVTVVAEAAMEVEDVVGEGV